MAAMEKPQIESMNEDDDNWKQAAKARLGGAAKGRKTGAASDQGGHNGVVRAVPVGLYSIGRLVAKWEQDRRVESSTEGNSIGASLGCKRAAAEAAQMEVAMGHDEDRVKEVQENGVNQRGRREYGGSGQPGCGH